MKNIEEYKKYVGKYIRNQFGIAKVLEVFESSNDIFLKLDNNIVYFVDEKTNMIDDKNLHFVYPITEHTQNLDERIKDLIELIEVGDYVNGCKVYENRKTYLMVYQKVKNSEVDYNYINHNEIKSIVTHEQF